MSADYFVGWAASMSRLVERLEEANEREDWAALDLELAKAGMLAYYARRYVPKHGTDPGPILFL